MDDSEIQNTREEGAERRMRRIQMNDELDLVYGYERLKDYSEHIGWLVNMQPTEIVNEEDKRLLSAVDYYFFESSTKRFKVTLTYRPYFFVLTREDCENDVSVFLTRKYGAKIASLEIIAKDDLDLPNHLIGLKRSFLKLSFYTVDDLVRVKREVAARVRRQQELARAHGDRFEAEPNDDIFRDDGRRNGRVGNALASANESDREQFIKILDIREHDVPYHVRVAIDLRIHIGCWYKVRLRTVGGSRIPEIDMMEDRVEQPTLCVLAYDIETTKQPLRFPDASSDQIMMVSYVVDGAGYLIVNREIVSADVDAFTYAPEGRPEFTARFDIFNEQDEQALLSRFVSHVQALRPHCIVSYNGDNFDWPFVAARCAQHGIDLVHELGFQTVNAGGQDSFFGSRACMHMDCLRWVRRDSYLPIGSHGLKAVTKAKLRYNPVELDPEEMCRMAVEQPCTLARYSVSDAVATYYLYTKYVHQFIFALCTILPLEPDAVLRKGSGTLCESLLMVRAFHAGIIFPNKQQPELNKLTNDGHLLIDETYVGASVEALESGVFRADLNYRFRVQVECVDLLIADLDRTLRFALETDKVLVEGERPESCEKDSPLAEEDAEARISAEDYETIRADVQRRLEELRNSPNRFEKPLVYHLDVGAMYPNIILTNRLQPSAMVDEATCARCYFNKPGARCQRRLEWVWRGDMLPASSAEHQTILQQLENERFPAALPNFQSGDQQKFQKAAQKPFGNFRKRVPDRRSLYQRRTPRSEESSTSAAMAERGWRSFHELSNEEQAQFAKKRLTDYCKVAYKKAKLTREDLRTSVVCQRENAFYVDTVRAFRDRRYEFKRLSKLWKDRLTECEQRGDDAERKRCSNMLIVYESLQVAYKCILNSFYGYVMRRGSRWHSMEMAGIVCHVGSRIITKARQLIEKIGRPLELDTDGIWCVLPISFPEKLQFQARSRNGSARRVTVSYPGALLNLLVHDAFTNDQYHELIDSSTHTYQVRSENSIFFEVDGPYRAMILPAAKEEGKKLKKRYAVFNFDGSLAELKGFEVKRNGELQLIKIFQSSVFEMFLGGESIEEAYGAVATVADRWLDVLFSRGASLSDTELLELIAERRSMSRRLEDYGEQRSTCTMTARRLAEFLGDQVVKDAGLACSFIIANKPDGAPVTQRAIPTVIFQAESAVRTHYLRRWLKLPTLNAQNFDIRSIIDWTYYLDRLGSCIQKIITIPAALQHVANPVPRVPHPEWLFRRLRSEQRTASAQSDATFRQRTIAEMFASIKPQSDADAADKSVRDIEDIADRPAGTETSAPTVAVSRKRKLTAKQRFREMLRDLRFDADSLTKSWRQVLGEPPKRADFEDDAEHLAAFVAFHKRKWRFQCQQRAELLRRGGEPGSETSDRIIAVANRTISARSGVIGGYLNRVQRSLFDAVWQIVQIAPTRRPGTFRLWALVGSELHALTLTVDRTFFVNKQRAGLDLPRLIGSAAAGRASHRKLTKYLPRSHPLYNLIELRVAEMDFQQNLTEILTNLMATDDVLGVYEMNVPLMFRALVRLGCVCSVNRDARRPTEQTTFDIRELQFRSVADSDYLQSDYSRHLLNNPIYIYAHRSGQKALFAVVVSATRKMHVFAIDRVRTNQMPNVVALYRTEYARALRETESGTQQAGTQTQQHDSEWMRKLLPDFAEVECEVHVETRLEVVYRGMQRVLNAYANEKRGPAMVVLQSSLPSTTLYDSVSILAEFAVIRIPLADSPVLYDVLDWQRVAVRTFIGHFLESKLVVHALAEQCRFMHMPLGNVPQRAHPFAFACDLFYARSLERANHLLWTSADADADADSTGFDFGQLDLADSRLLLSQTEDTGQEALNRPGLYAAVCVEFELRRVDLSAILHAARLFDLEGVASAISFDTLQQSATVSEMLDANTPRSHLTACDELAASSTAWRILKGMIAAWFKPHADTESGSGLLSEQLLATFYSWLRTSCGTLLHDPALSRMLNRLMRRLLLRLLAELEQLGAYVVHATPSRVVVCTRKRSHADAVAYFDYITNALRAKELFTALRFRRVREWQVLLWLDAANFAGIRPSDAHNVAHTDVDADADVEVLDVSTTQRDTSLNDADAAEKLEMNFALAERLPEQFDCRRTFEFVIGGFLLGAFRYVLEEANATLTISRAERQLAAAAAPSNEPQNLDNTSVVNVSHNQSASTKVAALLIGDISVSQAVAARLKELVRTEISPHLFEVVQKMQKAFERATKHGGPQWTGPASRRYNPHSHAADDENENAKADAKQESEGEESSSECENDDDAVLTLIVTICHVLAVEPSALETVSRLRRNLLKIVNVGEFASIADFHLLAQRAGDVSIVLPAFVCASCCAFADVDVLRDKHVEIISDGETNDNEDADTDDDDAVESDDEEFDRGSVARRREKQRDAQGDSGRPRWFWKCSACSKRHRTEELETHLVAQLNSDSLAYQMQDLDCVKCRLVKRNNLDIRCDECSHAYRNARFSPEQLRLRLKALRAIAKSSGMSILHEVTSFLLGT